LSYSLIDSQLSLTPASSISKQPDTQQLPNQQLVSSIPWNPTHPPSLPSMRPPTPTLKKKTERA
jgi:hypothetical protein